jgi:hypothetical protein
MGNSHLLFESLFKRNVSAEDTKGFLTELTKEYPYFTAAQFFLLQQTEPGSNDYKIQAARTAILFNNPFWLSFQLNQSSVSPTLPDQVVEIQEKDEEAVYDAEIEELEKIHPLEETTASLFENQIIVIEQESGVEPAEEEPIENEIEPIAAATSISKLPQPISAEEEEINDTENTEENNQAEDDEGVQEKEIEPMNIKLNFTAATTTTEDTITFEPLHTSDYFASVGIKFSEEVKPGDKLGKQLKSFTDWLKTMKKIHTEQLPLQTEQSDIIIQKMAEKSNTEGEVLTEAMAEVLLQQGKKGKAIEVYQKLSLLSPSKSAYFAAKIDQLKG